MNQREEMKKKKKTANKKKKNEKRKNALYLVARSTVITSIGPSQCFKRKNDEM